MSHLVNHRADRIRKEDMPLLQTTSTAEMASERYPAKPTSRSSQIELECRRIPDVTPKVSFVLLDWSCRESFHFIDYLARQDIPRDRYEVIWIEYFDRHADGLSQQIQRSHERGESSPIDTYAILNAPHDAYYHKHLMYNVGILLAHGETVCFCDSDTMVRPGFVDSIVGEFAANPDIVLHHDEIRNHSQEFHPFRHPTFADVIGPGCTNWLDGRTTGLWDEVDPLHTRNYGACMTARRDDLIAIGGADMHIDYLGHICGPYEMTFRLRNLGREEVWNQNELLYHVWHPGQAGDGNYCGPHDGQNMSTTALEALQSSRIQPLVENEAIRSIRERDLDHDNPDSIDELLSRVIDPACFVEWDERKLDVNGPHADFTKVPVANRNDSGRGSSETKCDDSEQVRTSARRMTRVGRLCALALIPGLLRRHLRIRLQSSSNEHALPQTQSSDEPSRRWRLLRYLPRKARTAYAMMRRMLDYETFLLRLCWRHLCHAEVRGCREIVLFGDGDTARIIVGLSKLLSVEVRAICPFDPTESKKRYGREVWAIDRLADYEGMVLLTSIVNVEQRLTQLQEIGITRERVITMQA
jgi:hypothetical protein